MDSSSALKGMQVGTPHASGASRIAPIYNSKSERPSWTQPFLRIIWEPSSVDTQNTGRLTLALQPDGQTMDFYDLLDATVLKMACESSVVLFGKQLTAEQVALTYTSPLRRSTRGAHIRAKLVPPGQKYSTLVWSEEKQPLPWPTGSWLGQECKAQLVLSSIWIAGGRWGLTLTATNIILRPITEMQDSDPVCPF
jgi:hypothetical protein